MSLILLSNTIFDDCFNLVDIKQFGQKTVYLTSRTLFQKDLKNRFYGQITLVPKTTFRTSQTIKFFMLLDLANFN